ncbi:MAG: hypothetical protein D6771_08040 [Zetaproteobacteria bacterium]|nr:MAG: hypothetical protein D6771_08040 [Zetaproteobacteria bacterium]
MSRLWWGLVFCAALAGCGQVSQQNQQGAGGTNTAVGAGGQTITLQLQPTTLVPGDQATITAKVVDAYGQPVSGQVVSFTTTSLQDTITPSQATTDAQGLAKAQMKAGNQSGTFTLTASVGGANGADGSVSINYTVKPAGTITISTYDQAGRAAVSVPVGQPLTVVAHVVDGHGRPVVKALVKFSVGNTQLSQLSPQVGTALTDAYGDARVTVTGLAAGADVVTATAQLSGGATVTGSGAFQFTSGAVGANAQSRVSLSLSRSGVNVGGSTLATATVTDANGNPLSGQIVRFRLAGVTPGVASVSPTSALTDAYGQAQATLTGQAAGADVLIAEVVSATNQVTASAQASFQVSQQAQQPARIQLVANRYVIRTDNATQAKITAVVTDAYGGPVSGAVVTFSATGGQLAARQVATDAYGQASTSLTSGLLDKRNQTVTVSADVGSGLTASVPIQITGTTVRLSNQTSSLQVGGLQTDAVYATVTDAAGNPVFNAAVAFRASGAVQIADAGGYGAGVWSATSADLYTDANGQAWVIVKGGAAAGNGQLVASSLGASASLAYTVSNPANAFAVTQPAVDPYMAYVDQYVWVHVQPGASNTVTVATSLGDLYTSPTGTRLSNPHVFAVAGGAPVDVYVHAQAAGTATVSITSDIYGTITRTVQFVQPPQSATTITLNTNANVIAPSAPPNLSTAKLVARVTSLQGGIQQPVGGATVRFYIPAPAGSGEYVTPPTATTDAQGVASATFVAGTQPTGAAGVDVYAEVVDANTGARIAGPAKVKLVVGGQAVSIAIGRGTTITSPNPGTYAQPVAIVVTDSSGAPVPNANVTIRTWPKMYRFGKWKVAAQGGCVAVPYLVDVNSMRSQGSQGKLPIATLAGNPNAQDVYAQWDDLYTSAKSNNGFAEWIFNEDVNRNLVLDPYEDLAMDVYATASHTNPIGKAPANGAIDPPSAAGGSAPSTVVTDQNGVATFDLVYPKAYAEWVTTEITASTNVFGSEASTVITFVLPASQSDAQQCVLPNSPFNRPGWP